MNDVELITLDLEFTNYVAIKKLIKKIVKALKNF